MKQAPLQRAVIFLLVVAPIVATSYLAFTYVIEVPFTDSWDVIPVLLQKQAAGALSFQDFWAQHNEQRLLFPRLAMLPLANLSGWNVRVGVGLNILLAALLVLVLLRMWAITVAGDGGRWALWMPVVFVWSTFSTVPWENWIWELSGTLFFMNVLAAATAFWCLARWPDQWKGLGLAALAAVVSMYSLGNGMLVWAVGFVVLLLARRPRPAHLVFWCGSGALAIGSYFYRFARPIDTPDLFFVLDSPLVFLQYVVTVIGSPWRHSLGKVPVIGVAGLVGVALFVGLTVWAWRRGEPLFHRVLPWVALGGFVLANAVLTGVSRSAFGVGQAFASRYVSITNLFWNAFFVLAFVAVADRVKRQQGSPKAVRPWYAVASVLAVLCVLGYADAYEDGITILRRESHAINGQKMCVLSGCFSTRCGNVLNIRAQKFAARIETLRHLEVGPFRRPGSMRDLALVPEPPGQPVGQLERVSWKRLDETGAPMLVIHGWAVDPETKAPARRVVVLANGTLIAQVPGGGTRYGETAAGRGSASKPLAWEVCVSPSRLVEDPSTIRAYAVLGEGTKAVRLQGEQRVSKPVHW